MKTVRLSSDPMANDIPEEVVVGDEGLLEAFRGSAALSDGASGYYDSEQLDPATYDWSTVFPSLHQSVEIPAGWDTANRRDWSTQGREQSWFSIILLVFLILLLFG